MLDNDETSTGSSPEASEQTGPAESAGTTDTPAAAKKTVRKRAAKTAKNAAAEEPGEKPAKKAAVKKTAAKKAVKKAAAAPEEAGESIPADEPAPAKKTATKRTTKKAAVAPEVTVVADSADPGAGAAATPVAPVAVPLFQAPDVTKAPPRKRAAKKAAVPAEDQQPPEGAEDPAASDASEARPAKKKSASSKKSKAQEAPAAETDGESNDSVIESQDAPDDQGRSGDEDQAEGEDGTAKRRPRRRGGRRRGRKSSESPESPESSDTAAEGDQGEGADGEDANGPESASDEASEQQGTASRRRRRRRRSGEDSGGGDDPENTVTRVRRPRNPEDEITALSGSTRLEAKKQRRREGREAGRRRAPIVSEAEFLARREAVDRVMVVRQREDLTQIGVLEDKVLVEHYVARESQTSLIGNVYLGRVQNVLPSMEAAFIDIGKGRNAVLYAGEVNWKGLGAKDGQPRKIESVLKSGQTVLVQVTKDPIGHKGARLTSQISLPGRFLVYVPDGTTSGISRKLPENERNRLKTLLKEIVPDSAGVIVRTAAEGASEDELTKDVERLTARWGDIEAKVQSGGGKQGAPQLLYGEPDLTLKVVRDLFTEDFTKLIVQGDDAWELVDNYVGHVAPELRERLERFEPGEDGRDVFADHRIDEQIAKGLDRKVWLPSGGSLIIDRTEAMTVVDVNTGKFTGSGGNLEETVTKNNLEAAEEIVRQLRLRDIGGIIVVDFIDMVLESNRDLVLRRMIECLGRDRTRHQVAEVTSLGLVQMTRKRIGTGLLEAFSEDCQHCKGRGIVVHDHPIEPSQKLDEQGPRGGRRGRGGRGRNSQNDQSDQNGKDQGNGSGQGRGGQHSSAPSNPPAPPSPKDVAAIARAENADRPPLDEQDQTPTPSELPVSPDAEKPEVTTDPTGPTEPVVEESAPAEQPESSGSSEPEQPALEQAGPPRVVTRVRRRSASRPAGPPQSSEEERSEPTPSSDQSDQAGPTVDQDAEPGAVHDDQAAGEATTDEDVPLLHVPVKRKGSRRR